MRPLLEYAELADLKNYQAYRTDKDSGPIAIVHISPSAAEPQNVAKVEEASKRLRQADLWGWASKSLEEKKLGDAYTVEGAIALAREAEATDAFEYSNIQDNKNSLDTFGSVFAATAAIALSFRVGRSQE